MLPKRQNEIEDSSRENENGETLLTPNSNSWAEFMPMDDAFWSPFNEFDSMKDDVDSLKNIMPSEKGAALEMQPADEIVAQQQYSIIDDTIAKDIDISLSPNDLHSNQSKKLSNEIIYTINDNDDTFKSEDGEKNAPKNLMKPLAKKNPEGWYETSFMVDYIHALKQNGANVRLCSIAALKDKPVRPESFAVDILYITNLSATEDKSITPLNYLDIKIDEIVLFLSRLGTNLPKHFRAVLLINNNHFVGVDIEFNNDGLINNNHFVGIDIEFNNDGMNVSYINTLVSPSYDDYDFFIPNKFIAALNAYFPDKTCNFGIVVDNIQTNGKDCGPLMVEWISLGTLGPKLVTDGISRAGETPAFELANDARYLRECGKASNAMRQMQANFVKQSNLHKDDVKDQVTTSTSKRKYDEDEFTNASENEANKKNKKETSIVHDSGRPSQATTILSNELSEMAINQDTSTWPKEIILGIRSAKANEKVKYTIEEGEIIFHMDFDRDYQPNSLANAFKARLGSKKNPTVRFSCVEKLNGKPVLKLQGKDQKALLVSLYDIIFNLSDKNNVKYPTKPVPLRIKNTTVSIPRKVQSEVGRTTVAREKKVSQEITIQSKQESSEMPINMDPTTWPKEIVLGISSTKAREKVTYEIRKGEILFHMNFDTFYKPKNLIHAWKGRLGKKNPTLRFNSCDKVDGKPVLKLQGDDQEALLKSLHKIIFYKFKTQHNLKYAEKLTNSVVETQNTTASSAQIVSQPSVPSVNSVKKSVLNLFAYETLEESISGEWYETGFFGDYLTQLEKQDASIMLCPAASFADQPYDIKQYANKILCCFDMSATVEADGVRETKIENLQQQIEMVINFIATNLKENMPRHLRVVLHIQGNHFVGVDVEFTKDKINISYINTSNQKCFEEYNEWIPSLFSTALSHYFALDVETVSLVDKIQLNGDDCGPMITEWLGLGTTAPKLYQENATTPFVELTNNNGAYFRFCAENSIALRTMQSDFKNGKSTPHSLESAEEASRQSDFESETTSNMFNNSNLTLFSAPRTMSLPTAAAKDEEASNELKSFFAVEPDASEDLDLFLVESPKMQDDEEFIAFRKT